MRAKRVSVRARNSERFHRAVRIEARRHLTVGEVDVLRGFGEAVVKGAPRPTL